MCRPPRVRQNQDIHRQHYLPVRVAPPPCGGYGDTIIAKTLPCRLMVATQSTSSPPERSHGADLDLELRVTLGATATRFNDIKPPGTAADAPQTPARALTALIAAPTIEIGAADEGVVHLAETLARAGHHPIVASSGGRLEARLAEAGAELIRLDLASRNPGVIARN